MPYAHTNDESRQGRYGLASVSMPLPQLTILLVVLCIVAISIAETFTGNSDTSGIQILTVLFVALGAKAIKSPAWFRQSSALAFLVCCVVASEFVVRTPVAFSDLTVIGVRPAAFALVVAVTVVLLTGRQQNWRDGEDQWTKILMRITAGTFLLLAGSYLFLSRFYPLDSQVFADSIVKLGALMGGYVVYSKSNAMDKLDRIMGLVTLVGVALMGATSIALNGL